MESVVKTSTGMTAGLAVVGAGASAAHTGELASTPHKNKVERKVMKNPKK